MTSYEWEGKTLRGETRTGQSSAESPRELRADLRRDGVILTRFSERKDAKGKASFRRKV